MKFDMDGEEVYMNWFGRAQDPSWTGAGWMPLQILKPCKNVSKSNLKKSSKIYLWFFCKKEFTSE